MPPDAPPIEISRVFDAPRALVYRAFTDPDHFAAWWGPVGTSLPREQIDFDLRPGGHQRWTEVSAADPDLLVHVHVDLAEVIDGELLDGLMHVTGRLPAGVEPFATRVRVEFHDEDDGRTRLEIRQWLPRHETGHAQQGWQEALTALDAVLAGVQASPSSIGGQ
jgi:uncharacterized protein YndB with AHSA1/START domain